MFLNELFKENKLFFRGCLLRYMYYVLSYLVVKFIELEYLII